MFRKLINKLFDNGVEEDNAAPPVPQSTKSMAERRGVTPPVELPSDPAEKLKVLLLNGRKLEAIKLYKELTGLSLAQAKADMEALEQEVTEQNQTTAQDKQLNEVYMLLVTDQRVEAIARYRRIMGVDQATAKEVIAHMEQKITGGTYVPANEGITHIGQSQASLSLADVMPTIYRHIETGKKIEAIKLYRSVTGLGLVEAKEAVEALERGERPPSTAAPAGNPALSVESIMPVLIELLRRKQKINAIKLYRETTGLGLKESKDFVDDLERRL